ncbi:DDB1- and CUL4-associated factor 13 [Tanacetum coccineum]
MTELEEIMLLLKEHYAALTAQITAFSNDFRLVFADYNGVHEKRKAVEKIEDAFETPPATVTVMEDVRIESVDEDVSVKVNDEGSTSGNTIKDESVRIVKNEPVDPKDGNSLNLVVVVNDVGDNGFSAVDHQWEGDLFATVGAAQVGVWDRNKLHPDDTSEWGSGSVISIRFNPGEPNILATSGNDLGITIYGLGLKDEAIKMFEDNYQSLEVKMRCKDRMHKSQQDKAHNFMMLCKQLELRVIEIVNKLKERTQRLKIWDPEIKIIFFRHHLEDNVVLKVWRVLRQCCRRTNDPRGRSPSPYGKRIMSCQLCHVNLSLK